MTSVFYEKIRLNDASVKSLEKCEKLSDTKERAEFDKKRKAFMIKVTESRTKRGYKSVY